MTVHDLGCNRKYMLLFLSSYQIHLPYNFGQSIAHPFLMGKLFLFTSDTSFQEFVNSPCMTEIKERSCFIHIDVPGHADNADKLPDS